MAIFWAHNSFLLAGKSITFSITSPFNIICRPFLGMLIVLFCNEMRRRGLEPPCLSALAPQASVSTNSTIAAILFVYLLVYIYLPELKCQEALRNRHRNRKKYL